MVQPLLFIPRRSSSAYGRAAKKTVRLQVINVGTRKLVCCRQMIIQAQLCNETDWLENNMLTFDLGLFAKGNQKLLQELRSV
jgi:hypothetical protein